jgi:arylsulfatase A
MRPITALAAALLLITSSATAIQQSPPDRPNVVLIMTDDAGYADTGSYGAPDIRTPNVDSLARDGVKLTDFYANGMSCTPTRAGLISGRYQQRYGIEFVIPAPGLPGAERGLRPLPHSLPLLMRKNGYATALVGKWHLGYTREFSPRAHGFDLFFGSKSAAIDYYTHFTARPSEGAQFVSAEPDLWDGDALVEQDGYMTDLITRRSVEFINQNATRPFFIDVAFTAPHSPVQRPDGPVRTPAPGSATRADYAAVMERVDRGVGEILQTLRARGLEQNTIVIFTNDNGGVGLSHSAPLFHRKFSAWEGGIRVPALIRWPGRIPAGTVSAQVGVTMDLTASILAATTTPVPPDARLEGVDLFPILQRKAPQVERTLFWRTGGPSPVNMNQKAVRSGDWKLIIDGAVTRIFLFNVKADPAEREDWFARRQDLAHRLQQRLTEWERDVDAEAKAFAASTRSSAGTSQPSRRAVHRFDCRRSSAQQCPPAPNRGSGGDQ